MPAGTAAGPGLCPTGAQRATDVIGTCDFPDAITFTTLALASSQRGAGQPAITGWNWINTGGAAGWTLLGASDLDGNGVPDTIWQNNSTRQVSVNYYSFTNGQPVMTGWAWLQPNNTPGWHAVVPR